MMKNIHNFRYILIYLFLQCLTWPGGDGLFVPEEVPSLLSFVYNNIPPFAKGTDSRVGLGFRLGPNADFQMLFELGPQKETQTLPPIRGYESSRKRHIPLSVLQKQKQKQQLQAQYNNGMAPQPFLIKHSGTPDGWLSAWRNSLNSKHLTFQNRNEYYDQQPMLPTYTYNKNKLSYKAVQHLRQLYKEQPT